MELTSESLSMIGADMLAAVDTEELRAKSATKLVLSAVAFRGVLGGVEGELTPNKTAALLPFSIM